MAREKGMGNLQLEKGGRWTMRVSINGKRYCRSTRTKDRAQAERVLQRFLTPLGLGDRRLPLAEVWRSYECSPNRNELAPSTLASKRVTWMHFARWMEKNYLPVKDLGEVTSDMIGEYLAALRVDVCGSTYNGRVCVLREIFHTLAAKAGLEEDVWEGVRLRPDDCHSRRELTSDELKRLLDAAAQRPSGEWRTLFLIGLYTGLRLGDCCRLEWADVNLAAGVIQVVPQKVKRHRHGRPVTIPIHATLLAALTGRAAGGGAPALPSGNAGERDARPYQSGPILPQIKELYTKARHRVSDELGRIFKAANITTSVKIDGRKRKTPEATFHSLRHTFVSFAANAGIPLHFVQAIVGHESTAMTRHYYHEDVEGLRRAVAAIPCV
jgi:integrase